MRGGSFNEKPKDGEAGGAAFHLPCLFFYLAVTGEMLTEQSAVAITPLQRYHSGEAIHHKAATEPSQLGPSCQPVSHSLLRRLER